MSRNHVSYKTAVKLKASGFPQDKTAYLWRFDPDGEPGDELLVDSWERENYDYPTCYEWYAAPTGQEIADELTAMRDPYCLATINLQYVNVMGKWFGFAEPYAGSARLPKKAEAEETLAETLAAYYLQLHSGSDTATAALSPQPEPKPAESTDAQPPTKGDTRQEDL